MAENIDDILKGNAAWAEEIDKNDPTFFESLSKGQAPPFLWIGCADSRVPVTQLTNTMPGAIFVQRNVANLVVHTDANLMSVAYYAVKALKVKHIVVCGHYGCGGVKAAMGNESLGYIDSWVTHIKDVYAKHEQELNGMEKEAERFDRFVELNVQEQAKNMAKVAFIQEEWEKGEALQIHGLVYDLKNGRLKDLGISQNDNSQLQKVFRYDSK